MKNFSRFCLFLIALAIPTFGNTLNIGIGKADITPPIGTPSAGYSDRNGEGMEDIHDPLFAIALFLDNGDKKIVFCSVDHLGFTFDMIQEVIKKVHSEPDLSDCDVYIGSSHTHSGGGAYLNIPVLGKSLAGTYSPEITNFTIQKTTEAIIEASKNPIQGQIGIGYGYAKGLSTYRGLFPKDVTPLSDVAVIKITKLDGSPFAVLFNYPVHPTILKSQNRQFSADFVGYARKHIKSLLGKDIQPIYFNGAQGDIIPAVLVPNEDSYSSVRIFGKSLAESVQKIWDNTKTEESLHIVTQKNSYAFQPQATPFGLLLPLESYTSEMSVIVLNHLHAFITIPGELSCIYDQNLKNFGSNLGFSHVSIFGLTNDAHGYIILPKSWRNKTMESGLSFGGEYYGTQMETRAKALLEDNVPYRRLDMEAANE